MSKQILIDYEEYLELEKCKGVLDDLKTAIDFYGKVLAIDPADPMSCENFEATVPMPDSFRRYFHDNKYNMPLLKVTIQAKEV